MPEKVLILTEEGKPFAADAEKKALEILSQGNLEAVALSEKDPKANDELAKASFLIVRSNKVSAEVINRAPKLKLIVRAGVGYDNIDLAVATAKNIYVMNTPGQNATAVAELVMSMMHSAIRPLPSGKSGTELKNKKLGIIGFGNTGKLVAIIAKGYGMEVEVFDVLETKETAMQYGVKCADSGMDAVKGKDFVSIHIPATKENKNSVNLSYFEAMKEKEL